jgi:hypothetical protein
MGQDPRYVVPGEAVTEDRDLTANRPVPGNLVLGVDAAGNAQIQRHVGGDFTAQALGLLQQILEAQQRTNAYLALITDVELP